MNLSRSSYRNILFVLALCVSGAALFTSRVAGQDDVWQIARADYGWRDQRTDVTGLLLDLISRGGVNGRIAVNNQTMGGDPAIGKDKNLRIFARDRRGVEREFDYREGAAVESNMFAVPVAPRNEWGERDDRPRDRDNRQDDRDRFESRGLQIIRGYYGIQGRTVNVTEILRSRIREGVLSFRVENGALGGDPAIGADKVLIVIYRYQGQEQATAVREGNILTIP
jgi:hypothetical protein